MSEFTVGLDWGAREHSVCVVDASGRVRARWRVPHDREGLERLLRDLRRLADPSEFPIAIERPSGLLVDTLMDAGHPVIAIHPNIVKASRAPLGEKRLQAFLSKHAYCGRRSAGELFARLRAPPERQLGEHEDAAARDITLTLTLTLTSVLHTLGERLTLLTRPLEHASSETAIGQLIMSFPRTGRLNAAQIVAELGEDPHRFADSDHLASEAGVAPVTRASGKSHHVSSRFACNKRLKNAITTWANNSRHADPRAPCIYDRARSTPGG